MKRKAFYVAVVLLSSMLGAFLALSVVDAWAQTVIRNRVVYLEQVEFRDQAIMAGGGTMAVSDGSASAPSYSFASDNDIGFYRQSENTIGVGIAGTLSTRFVSAGIRNADGLVTVPSYSFGSDTDTGMYSSVGDGLAFSHQGNDLGEWYVATGTLTATQVRNLNATPVEVIAAVGAGNGVVIESSRLMLDWNANAYDNVGAGEDIYLVNDAGNILARCDETTCIEADAVADRFGEAMGDQTALGYELTDNDSISIAILSGEWAAADLDANGDSPIHYLIRYRIVSTDIS